MSIPEKLIIAALEEELPPVSMELSFPSVTESIMVLGDTVSTVQFNDAGVGFIFPTLSSGPNLKSMITVGQVDSLDRAGTGSKVRIVNTAFKVTYSDTTSIVTR